jgi:hypothetical protein
MEIQNVLMILNKIADGIDLSQVKREHNVEEGDGGIGP